MKKVLFYTISILLGASIPLYFTFIWEPLKSEKSISVNLIEVDNNAISSDKDEKSNNELVTNEKIDIRNNDIINKKEDIIKIKQGNITNGLFLELEKDKKQELNKIFSKLSIIDIIKINDYFSDIVNDEKLKEGILFVKKRISIDEYEYFKDIAKDYIELENIEGV